MSERDKKTDLVIGYVFINDVEIAENIRKEGLRIVAVERFPGINSEGFIKAEDNKKESLLTIKNIPFRFQYKRGDPNITFKFEENYNALSPQSQEHGCKAVLYRASVFAGKDATKDDSRVIVLPNYSPQLKEIIDNWRTLTQRQIISLIKMPWEKPQTS